MKRRDLFERLWREARGILKTADPVAVAGGGASGLHLALALAQKGFIVTVYEPAKIGGLRVPLMHACHTTKPRQPLWEAAAEWTRNWYAQQTFSKGSLEFRENTFGKYFVIHSRRYLRDLRNHLLQRGVTIRSEKFDTAVSADSGYRGIFVATGEAVASRLEGICAGATQLLPGFESYFANQGLDPVFSEADTERNLVTTNFMAFGSRAGYIHRNRETEQVACSIARSFYPKGRAALFRGTRLTSRDRLPVAGFLPGTRNSVFLFCAMGYHAMTYAPYLAEKTAAWLIGENVDDGNLICGLTPARFLPRDQISKTRVPPAETKNPAS